MLDDISNTSLNIAIASFAKNSYEENVLKRRFIKGETYENIIGFPPDLRPEPEEKILCDKFEKYIKDKG